MQVHYFCSIAMLLCNDYLGCSSIFCSMIKINVILNSFDFILIIIFASFNKWTNLVLIFVKEKKGGGG